MHAHLQRAVHHSESTYGYKITLQLGENVPENAGIVAYDADELPIMNGDIPVYRFEMTTNDNPTSISEIEW